VVTHAPDLAAPAGRIPATSVRPSRSRLVDAALLGALAAATALVFAGLQRRLAIRANDAYASLDPRFALNHPGREAVIYSLGPFLAVLTGSIVLAGLRHRVAAFAILASTAFTTITQSLLGVLPADRGLFSRVGPTPLGPYWTNGFSRPDLTQLWRATAIDYSLAFLPAVALVAWTMSAETKAGESRARIRPRLPTRSEAAGLACSACFFWLVLHTWELREALQGSPGPGIGTDLVAFLPFFLLGVALSRGPRWRLLAAAGVPILWATTWATHILIGDVAGLERSEVHAALPFVGVVAAGLLWRPIASFTDRELTRPWLLVLALNVLNVADLVFTRIALHSGQAVEANPFAAWIGPGVKLVGVGIASILVARFRPRALIWLVMVFAAVIVWHLSGVVLDTS
jgi:hypothetical protein